MSCWMVKRATGWAGWLCGMGTDGEAGVSCSGFFDFSGSICFTL